ncbi:hypothetical protein ACIRSJ_01565 [Streptomyces virginiae]|uniref:hypothetical protein n=1 Tax=Streptomyces virginiae TaxID=1961 RepID=UPI003805182A
MRVCGESGDVVARAGCGLDWFSLLATVDRSVFPMLGALDPYRDVVFNQRQIPSLLAELEQLPVERGGQWVQEVRDLCQVVAQGTHRYLEFIGD